jgi:hypothetical protein
MTGQDYSVSITANITAEDATERINRVADWWTKSFTGASGKVGDAFTVRFGETFVNFAVAEIVPGRKIVWRVTDCNLDFIEDKKEWKDTRVVFDISAAGPPTTVTMTHAGLVPGVECYEACRKGWNFYITESLQKLLRENQGMPDGGGRRDSSNKAKITFGSHSSVIVPRQDRDRIRKFYSEVLGGVITKEENERDFLRLGENFYLVFLYADVPDESEFLRTARSIWLEIKSDNVEELRQKVLDSGLVRKLDIPDPHLYFQAPGGQCWRVVGINEDLIL